HTNTNTLKENFNPNQTTPGTKLKKSNGGNQPPKNSNAEKILINRILAYSPKKNKAKVIPEYSTLYPATNSASASGKSKGARFVSAKEQITNTSHIGNRGNTNHT